MVGITGRGNVAAEVGELTAVGRGGAGGITIGAIVVGVTGDGCGARGAKCIDTEEAAIGFAVCVFTPAPLRRTDPPVADMGVKSTPKATSAPPSPRSFLRLVRMLAPLFFGPGEIRRVVTVGCRSNRTRLTPV
jgi:hypothetical protein